MEKNGQVTVASLKLSSLPHLLFLLALCFPGARVTPLNAKLCVCVGGGGWGEAAGTWRCIGKDGGYLELGLGSKDPPKYGQPL